MKATAFVSASAVLFAGWLTVTFLREVSPKDYPTLGRGSVPVSASRKPASPKGQGLSLEKLQDAPVVGQAEANLTLPQ
jgi:hypothetical protein